MSDQVEAVADAIALVLRGAVPGWNDAQVAVDCAVAALSASKPLVVEECAKALQGKADLYQAYAERADRAGEQEKAARMRDHYATTIDDIRTIRALKESPSEARDGCGSRAAARSELQSPKGSGG